MDFTKLSAYLHNLKDTNGVPAYDMTVRVGRETVFQQREACRENGLYWYYSATKLFTATAGCRLLERGLIHLEDPVSRYLPEYAHLHVREQDGSLRPAKREPTIQNLFSMCGGLTYDIFSKEITGATDRTTLGIVREIAKMPLCADPGEMYMYSLCHDVLAGVVEAVTGVRYAAYIQNEIAGPLGMADMSFHPSPAQKARLEQQYHWEGRRKGAAPCEGSNKFEFSPDYDSGGAGLCGPARDYILLPEALACGGLGRDGYPLLKQETIDLMRRNQLTPGQTVSFQQRWARLGSYGYGLGVRTRVDHRDGGLSPVGEFGWDGAAGAYCIADPENKVSVLYAQHVLDMGPIYEDVHPKLRDLVYEGLRDE